MIYRVRDSMLRVPNVILRLRTGVSPMYACIVRGHMADFAGGFPQVAETLARNHARFRDFERANLSAFPTGPSCCRNHGAFITATAICL